MSVTIYIVSNMSADTVTNVSQILGLVKEIIVVIATIVILVTIVAHIVIDLLGLKAFTNRFRGFIQIPIAQVLTNQRASSGSCQTLPTASKFSDVFSLSRNTEFFLGFFVGTGID